MMQAFDLAEVPAEAEAEDDADDADEGALNDDIEMAMSSDATPEDRREAFIRAVKAAMRG